jgi:hypothetical protein
MPTLARDAASWEKGRPSGTPSVRIRAPRSVSAYDSRPRFSWVTRGVKSMSRVGGTAAAYSSPAYPPMTTYSTPRRLKAWTISSGSKRPAFNLSPRSWTPTSHPLAGLQSR